MSFGHYLRQSPEVSAQEAIELALGDLDRRSDEWPDGRLLLNFCTGWLGSSAAANLRNDWGREARNISKGLIDWRAARAPLIGGPAAG